MLITYCEQCHERLWQYGGIAQSMFEKICECYLFENSFLEIESSLEDLLSSFLGLIDFLEIKGYVITTEVGDNKIAVKPLGLFIEGERLCHICFDRHQHG